MIARYKGMLLEEYLSSEVGLKELTDLARDGKTLQEIANNYGTGRTTLYRISKKLPEVQSALDEGKIIADERVEQSLYEACFTRSEKTIVVEKNDKGEVVRTTVKTQVIPANVTAIQYWLSNRQSATWKARQQLELSADTPLPLVIKDDLDTTKDKE